MQITLHIRLPRGGAGPGAAPNPTRPSSDAGSGRGLVRPDERARLAFGPGADRWLSGTGKGSVASPGLMFRTIHKIHNPAAEVLARRRS
jgi:hypothetical protein